MPEDGSASASRWAQGGLLLTLFFLYPFVNFIAINAPDPLLDLGRFLGFAAATVIALLVVFGGLIALVELRIRRGLARRLISATGLCYILLFLFEPTIELFRDTLGILRGAVVAYAVAFLLTAIFAFKLAKHRGFAVAVVVFVATITALSVARTAIGLFSAGGNAAEAAGTPPRDIVAAPPPQAPARLPDVFIVIPDAYASVRTLRDVLDYDNGSFVSAMEARGFVHQDATRAAYTTTSMSIGALMRGDYPATASDPDYGGARSGLEFPANLRAATPPAAVSLATDLGYAVSFIGNTYSACVPLHLACPAPLGLVQSSYQLSLFLSPTPVRWLRAKAQILSRHVPLLAEFVDDESVGLDAVSRLRQLLRDGQGPPRPSFVFVHHLPPHPPYAFHADCRVRRHAAFDFALWAPAAKPYYVDNLKCTNRALLDLVDEILARDREAIVVVQGDHGTGFNVDFSRTPDQWQQQAIDERLSVISLVRAPQRCRDLMAPNMNGVNVIRFVIGCAIGERPHYVEN